MKCEDKFCEMYTNNSSGIKVASVKRGSNMLHETRSTNFNKSSSGRIYEADIKDMFSMLVICLDLKESKSKKSLITKLLGQQFSYSFSIDEALEVMKAMSITIEHSMTSTVISYSIGPDLGLALLKRFYDTRFIHSPADRTRNKPKKGVALQPTPKGVAIVQDFCKKHGMKREHCPEILHSNFNSMDLINFERDLISDKILYSNYFLQLLFTRILGPKPNVWHESNEPESIPSLDEKLNIDEWMDFSSFGILSNYSMTYMANGFDALTKNFSTASITDLKSIKKSESVSPFYHRYFSNPESDSHTQYYISSGVRFFKDKKFRVENGNSMILDYCITGKALCQWLLDCTDIISIGHAVEIIGLLVQANMLVALNSNDIRSFKDRKAYFIIGPLGKHICPWNNNQIYSLQYLNKSLDTVLPELSPCSTDNFIDSIAFSKKLKNSIGSSDISLKTVLKDPGMRYIFRKHLENEFCRENLDAYILLNQYSKKVNILGKLLQARKDHVLSRNDKETHSQIIKLSDTCMSLAYHIYFTYLSSDSPCVLNIEYKLREKVSSILVHPNSIVSESQANYLLTPVEERTNTYEEGETSPVSISSHSSTLINVPQTLDPGNNTIITSDLKIQNQTLLYSGTDHLSFSPSQVDLSKNLSRLASLSSIFQEVINHTYRLMEIDSFPKFLNSDIYKQSFPLHIQGMSNL